jgi:TetR/AcrR family transcriptional regulator, transcriptional repressor for nem operon
MRASDSRNAVKWMPGNPSASSGSNARARILRAAADLFHKQGVRLTTPAEIIKASGTGRGQFYHYFKNKKVLVHEVLRCFLESLRTGRSPVNYDIASWQDVKRFFLSHIEFQQQFAMTRSCPIGTVANEVSEEDEIVRNDINRIMEMMKNKLAGFFAGEKAGGRLVPTVDPEATAEFCIAAIQGAMLLGKINRSSRPVEAAVREALLHLESYVVQPHQPVSMPAQDGQFLV